MLLAGRGGGLRGASPPPAAPPRWVAVTAPAFRAAVEPLAEHRKAQGMEVRLVQTTDVLALRDIRTGDASRLRDHVLGLCREAKGDCYVLLIGAVEPGTLADAETKVLPPLRGTVGRMKDQPSDNGFGCLGKELLPSVAVGRLPARSLEEARQMVQKVLAFERDDRPAPWRRQMTVLVGIPAFNPLVDRLVESMALARFDRLDPSWSGRAIYHNSTSRFCVPDDRLRERALEYVQAGQMLTLYLGHSWAGGLYGGKVPYLDRDDWAKLTIKQGPGLFATFGCNGCQLTGREGEGYGVAAIRNPAGPVAVLGSQGICFAAMVQLASNGLAESLLAAQPPQRLGTAWLRLKEGIAKGKIDDLTYQMLDAVDGDLKIPQATQRLEHLEMFVLLGDPALRLPQLPLDVQLQASEPAVPGKPLTLRGQLPAHLAGARLRLTLERPLTSTPLGLEPLPAEGPERARVMLANHDRANQFVLQTREAVVRDGRFELTWPLPEKLPWPRVLIRAYAATERRDGMGVLVLPLK